MFPVVVSFLPVGPVPLGPNTVTSKVRPGGPPRVYLDVLVDLFASEVVCWSMKPGLSRQLATDAPLMAVWRRKPTSSVHVHSDQGRQYGSDDFKRFCRANNLEPSMSPRANCWDNAVAESFFASLKKQRIRKRNYKTRELARADNFYYIEVLYDRARCHSYIGGVSPEALEAPLREAGKYLPNRGQSKPAAARK